MGDEETNETASVEPQFLSFEEIVAADDIQYETVPVPEWPTSNGQPGAVRLRTLRGFERDEYVQILQGRMTGSGDDRRLTNYKNLPSILLQKVMVKADGSALFTPAQVMTLQQKNADVINRLFTKAQEMNGLTDDEVVDTAKNSATDPNDASGIN
jgi:hypothetical protein